MREKECGSTRCPSAKLDDAFDMVTDNKAALKIASDRRVYHGTKHLEVKFHFIREAIEGGRVRFAHVDTENNLADIMTKNLGRLISTRLRDCILVKVPLRK